MVKENRLVFFWLLTCCACVFLMVVIGGLTRLTESGLSITEWKPVSGIIPPLSHTDWEAEFAKYRESPQYSQVNKGMSLNQFQFIFWMEFIHRLVGRLTGFVFFLPFIYFLVKRQLPKPLILTLGGIFLLGGLQGFMGWYMVKSGLVDRPDVSPYRLTMHLTLAFIIFALLWWQALKLRALKTINSLQLARFGWVVTGLILVQVALGGLVAGFDAGLIYNTFPTMNGQWIPDGLGTDAVTTVQFLHRLGALILTGVIITFWQATKADLPPVRWLLALFLLQITLGILTLVTQVPIALASLHQAVALALFGFSIFLNRKICGKKERAN